MENALKIKEDVLTLTKEIEALKGKDTLAIDISDECSWTDYFIISTCNSSAHLRGVVDDVRKLVHEMGYSIKQNRKNPGNQGWVLLDCVDFVVHLMNYDSREYYNLEDRWQSSETIYSSSKLS